MSKREIVERELKAIWDEKHQLTTQDVVERAENPLHSLHPYFEWDDSEAGKLYRLAQASELIRSVKIRFTVEHGDTVERVSVRSWVAARGAEPEVDVPPGYIPESEARQNPAIREAILRRMRLDVSNLRRRYSHLDEFWRVVDAMMEERTEEAS